MQVGADASKGSLEGQRRRFAAMGCKWVCALMQSAALPVVFECLEGQDDWPGMLHEHVR